MLLSLVCHLNLIGQITPNIIKYTRQLNNGRRFRRGYERSRSAATPIERYFFDVPSTARGSRGKCRTKMLINGRAFLLHRWTSDPFCCMLGLVMRFNSLFCSTVLGFFLPFVFVLAHAPVGHRMPSGALFLCPFQLLKLIRVNSS